MATDNEAPGASSANMAKPNDAPSDAQHAKFPSDNNSGQDGNSRNPRHEHRTRGRGRTEKGRGEWS